MASPRAGHDMVECRAGAVVPRGNNSRHCMRLSPIFQALDCADQDVYYSKFSVFQQAETAVEI